MCGDEVEVSIDLERGQIRDIAFGGRGCAISMASASMMTEVVKGASLETTDYWIQNVRAMLTGRDSELDSTIEWGDLEALQGVKKLPVRIKCALLAWEALQEALASAPRAATSDAC
jgi:nitrogen fixation NifU-like protein